jgi:hypothetical protein
MTPTRPVTYLDAMELLDARRNGQEMPESFVLSALELTGDYESNKPSNRYREPQFMRWFEAQA